MTQLSLVVPVLNECEHIEPLLDRCMRVCRGLGRSFEIILVDDGSSDGSRELMARATDRYPTQVVALILNRNYGQHAAIIAGMQASSGAIVVTLDADLQNPPEEIPKLLEVIDQGADVVGGVRRQRQDGYLRMLSSRLTNYFVKRVSPVGGIDFGCMLRAYRRDLVDEVLRRRDRGAFVPILAQQLASNPQSIDVRHARREDDASKSTLWKLVNLFFDLLTSTTTFPLRMMSVFGGAVALSGFLLAAVMLIARLTYGAGWAVDGVLTAFSISFFFMGVQLIGMGLLGEYLGRTYDEVRRHPRYSVKEQIGGRFRALDNCAIVPTSAVLPGENRCAS